MRLSSATTARASAKRPEASGKKSDVKVRNTRTTGTGCGKWNHSSPMNITAITAADTARSRTMRSYYLDRSRKVRRPARASRRETPTGERGDGRVPVRHERRRDSLNLTRQPDRVDREHRRRAVRRSVEGRQDPAPGPGGVPELRCSSNAQRSGRFLAEQVDALGGDSRAPHLELVAVAQPAARRGRGRPGRHEPAGRSARRTCAREPVLGEVDPGPARARRRAPSTNRRLRRRRGCRPPPSGRPTLPPCRSSR